MDVFMAGYARTLGALLTLLTTEARTSYPWPLCWGNALWGYVAFLKHRETQLPSMRAGPLFGVIVSFVLYTMPANLFTNWLIFVRTPGALASSLVLPCHLACCAAIMLCPGDGLYQLLGATVPYAIIDSLGVLDNATTGFNYIEEALASTGSVSLAILAGMSVNLAGGLVRHFTYNGYSAGAASFDDKLRANVLYSFTTCVFYYYAALRRCDGDMACVHATRLYEVLPWVAVARNLLPTVQAAMKKDKVA